MKTLSVEYRHTVPNYQEIQTHHVNKKSLSEELRDTYTSKYYESGYLQEYENISHSKNVKVVRYKDLADMELIGYPYAIDYNNEGDLQCHFSLSAPTAHELVVGTTGCGKTTCCVEPRMRILSSKKNKANLFLTDPKGELFEHNAEHLRKQGYRIYLLNFKDVLHSDCWNPLTEVYQTWIQQKGLKENLQHVFDKEALEHYELQGDPDEYSSEFWVYGKKAFTNEQSARRCYEDEIANIYSETADLVHQIVHTFIPDTMLSQSDPSWFMGAQEILSGILYAMLEDALDDRSGFTRDTMNLLTVEEYFDCIRNSVVNLNTGNIPLLSTKKLSHKSYKDISIKQLKSYFENAPTTTRSYLGCFRNAMQEWFNNKIFTICNGNTVNIDAPDDRPFAIFLITRDFEKSDFTIAGMFIDWVYRKLLSRADNNHGRLERETYFILDEFANIPAIKDFENKIATSRSRNIWFHMFIQSYAQIVDVYGSSAAQTIMDNCNSHVFLGSQNYETKARFAKECGKQAIPSLESVLNPATNKVVEVPLITIGKLESLRLGQMYAKRTGMPLLFTECKPSYQCKEFMGEKAMSPKDMGIESLPYNSEKYRYMYLETSKSMEEFSKSTNMPSKKATTISDFLTEII